MRMSGVLGQRLGRKNSLTSVLVSSVKYSVSSQARVAPGEVVVRLGEADLGQVVHNLGPGEGLGEEDRVGVVSLYAADEPLPEAQGLGMGVVDAEDLHALARSRIRRRYFSSAHSLAPVRSIEVEGVDVLVLLGRVLGVLDRVVGTQA